MSGRDDTNADPAPIDFLAIGHVTLDATPAGNRAGGAAAYAAVLAHRLGLRAGIVTSAGPDSDLSELAGVFCHASAAPRTTCFENVYQPWGREQRVTARALPLTPADVPPAWWRAGIIFLAPVAGEVLTPFALPETDAVVGMGLQGWLRRWDEAGRVRTAYWPDPNGQIARADFVFLSEEDLAGDPNAVAGYASLARCLILTRGPLGCRVYQAGTVLNVPASPAREIDPTGAGDVFAAAFLIRWRETGDLVRSARFAHAAAALTVEQTSLAALPDRRQILERLACAEAGDRFGAD